MIRDQIEKILHDRFDGTGYSNEYINDAATEVIDLILDTYGPPF